MDKRKMKKLLILNLPYFSGRVVRYEFRRSMEIG